MAIVLCALSTNGIFTIGLGLVQCGATWMIVYSVVDDRGQARDCLYGNTKVAASVVSLEFDIA